MSHQDYRSWFLAHSGKEAQKCLSQPCKSECPKKDKPKEKKEKGENNYERWFYRNCDNNNLPDLAEIKSHDYDTWFHKHCIKRKKCCSDNDKSYAAWFERNRDNRNPGVVTKPPLTYEEWFGKHRTPSIPVKTECVKKHESYEAWFKRHK